MSQTMIEVTPQRLFCPAHGELLRPSWPAGMASVGMPIVYAALQSKALADAARAVGVVPEGQLLDHELINTVTAKRPFCYFAERSVIEQAFRGFDGLVKTRCDNCGIPRVGGLYKVEMPDGEHKDLDHLCIECMLDAGDRFHAAHPDGEVWR